MVYVFFIDELSRCTRLTLQSFRVESKSLNRIQKVGVFDPATHHFSLVGSTILGTNNYWGGP